MFCVSGFGGSSNPTTGQINMVVASTIMFNLAFGLTWAPAPYTTAAEMSSSAVSSAHVACPPTSLIIAATREDDGNGCRSSGILGLGGHIYASTPR